MLASGSSGADREIESFRQMLDSLPKISGVDAPVKLQVNQQKPDRDCHAQQFRDYFRDSLQHVLLPSICKQENLSGSKTIYLSR